MFTAIVLICIQGSNISNENCITIDRQELVATEKECQSSIVTALDLGIFNHTDAKGRSWNAVDWSCVRWNSVTT